MMENQDKYVFGIDFGTLSARAVLVNVKNGEVVATAAMEYKHGVMDRKLMEYDIDLPNDWALQYPMDYIECIKKIIPLCMKKAEVKKEHVIGVGTDFTECTMLPTLKDGTPLCCVEEYKENPHAYVKLWKHHSAQDEANELNAKAKQRVENFLNCYGGKISSEWMFPKIWQILNEAPEIYEKAQRFMELADWITLMLTGEEKRNSCTAGYKAMWQKGEGYPSDEFFRALDERMYNVIDEKMSREIYQLGTKAGEITEQSAQWTGLEVGTPVAVGCGDAHSAVPGSGITEPAVMLMVMGTSGCDMMVSEQKVKVPGICGLCEDGILPNYYAYEAGQSCMGDHFEWLVKNIANKECYAKASEYGLNIYQWLDEEAEKIQVGKTGLLALDWWNGNRSCLVDVDLTGMILGMNLSTTPIDIYKALVEAVAYGKRKIVENFEQHGVRIDKLVATGGIAEKSCFVMQTFADVLNREIHITAVKNATAMGSAVFGAVVADKNKGGYHSIKEAVHHMCNGVSKIYKPNHENVIVYEKLYKEFEKLHDYFGKTNNVMKILKAIKE